MNVAFNEDCMEGMKRYPDKYFDLAVVDPPYGNDNEYNSHNGRFGGHFDKYDLGTTIKIDRTGRTWAKKYQAEIKSWDVTPDESYFMELARVSKNQIIFGGNYFDLPPTRCFIVWHKTDIPINFTMSNCEYAWTSFNKNAKFFECATNGRGERFHPTQKPIELYRWVFKEFAKDGDKILDTHMGSGSSRIAAYDMNLDYVGMEIYKPYFDKAEDRYQLYTSELRMEDLWVDRENQMTS